MRFELLPDKVSGQKLVDGDHIMVNDMLFRVVANFHTSNPGGGRMLQLAFHTHEAPKTFKFHQVDNDVRHEVFRRID